MTPGQLCFDSPFVHFITKPDHENLASATFLFSFKLDMKHNKSAFLFVDAQLQRFKKFSTLVVCPFNQEVSPLLMLCQQSCTKRTRLTMQALRVPTHQEMRAIFCPDCFHAQAICLDFLTLLCPLRGGQKKKTARTEKASVFCRRFCRPLVFQFFFSLILFECHT